MSRRQPMAPVDGLKKPTLPPPTRRPRTLAPVPPPAADTVEPVRDDVIHESASTDIAPATVLPAAAAEPALERPEEPATAAGTVQSPRSATADVMKPVSVSLPLSLAEAWRDRAKRDRTSQVGVLLDAIVAHQSELDQLIIASTARPTVSDGLFDRGVTPRGERSVGVSLRIKAGNLEVIDRLADRHGPVKRSPFVATVLSAYLA